MGEAWIVVDLAFGDAGKGTTVDWLARARGAALVVRWNGGAQAGHTVVTPDGRRHVFSQFGAGTFVPGVRTHLAADVVVHPTALLVEARRLEGALERLTVHPEARVITPFHQAAGRIREIARGAARHGSCGVGVGETVRDGLEHEPIRMRDLYRDGLRARVEAVRERLRAALPRVDSDEWAVFERRDVVSAWIDALAPIPLGEPKLEGTVIFEGAQGVLLDEAKGFHPHTTWSDCTPAGAREMLRGFDGPVRTLGVLRTYFTRHGEGPFPTEDPALGFPSEHEGGWPRPFRFGWFDAPLARYAAAACGGLDGLAITHLDRVRPGWRAATGYEPPVDLRWGDLAHQERLGRALATARPVYAPVAEFVPWIEEALGVPVLVESRGPSASDKRARLTAPTRP